MTRNHTLLARIAATSLALASGPVLAQVQPQSPVASKTYVDGLVSTLTTAIGLKAPSNSPALTGTPKVADPTCAATAGQYIDPYASYGWQIGCSGTFASTTPSIITFATRGVEAQEGAPPWVNPKTVGAGLSQWLINFKSLSQASPENALTINMDVDRGHAGLAGGENAQKVGMTVFASTRPGPSGMKPGTVWGMNTDIVQTPGSGAVFTLSWEADLTINNPDCGPNSPSPSGCFAGHTWYAHGGEYPADFDVLHSSQFNGTRSGTLNTNGTSITAVTYPNLPPYATGPFNSDTSIITINGVRYRVISVESPTTATLLKSAGVQSGVPFSWHNNQVKNGILMSGTAENPTNRDNDIVLNTSAHTAINIGGEHRVGINTSNDAAMDYAFIAKAQQSICLDGIDSCFRNDGSGTVALTQGGATTFKMRGTDKPLGLAANRSMCFADTDWCLSYASISNVFGLTVAGQEYWYLGPDGRQYLPAQTFSQGNGFRRPAYTPASATAACTAGDEAADANYLYRCVSDNAWKRAALSTW